MNEAYIRKHNPELYQKVKSKFGDRYKFMESMFMFNSELDEPPVCKVCGGPVKFRNVNLGYQIYCSAKCSNSDPDKVTRTKQTCTERYGGPAPACSGKISQKMVDTTYRNHGKDAFVRRTGSLSEDTKEKMKVTCRERYGVDNVMKLEEYQEKCNEGKDYTEIGKKIKETWRKIRLQSADIQDVLEDGGIFRVNCPHPTCTKCQERWFDIKVEVYHDRKYTNRELCTRLFPVQPAGTSNTYPEKFVRDILDSHGILYITSDRTILSGKELDIYIPSHHLAIECNGVYWHSLKDKSYHYNKWKSCAELGIQLLSIWEDWIVHKPEIVKSIILSKLGIYDTRIGARQCTFGTPTPKEARAFLRANHIQGDCRSSIWMGLYYNSKLVCLMGFDKFGSRVGIGNSDDVWELTRFCSLRNIQVIHGADRLLMNFIRNHPGDTIISFSSHDISDGGLYRRLGFKESSETASSYWYVDKKNLKRYHRFSFTKKSLVDKGYDPNMTEFEIMSTLPYYRIYDSGQTKWIYNEF